MNYKIIYKNFNSILGNNYKYIRNYNIILDVEFPILFTFESNNKLFLVYVLEYKRIKKKFEFFITETKYDHIIELINQKRSLNSILYSDLENSWCVNTKNITQDINDEILKKLPQKEFYISPLLPNKIDLEETQLLIKNNIRERNLVEYVVNQEILDEERLFSNKKFNFHHEKFENSNIFKTNFINKRASLNPKSSASDIWQDFFNFKIKSNIIKGEVNEYKSRVLYSE